jgi:signal transduction histidine kinase
MCAFSVFLIALPPFKITDFIEKNEIILLSFITIVVLLLFIMVYMSISRSRQLKAMEHLKQVAEESNQLKNSFIANMTHELRTPLNAIIGFINVLAETDNLSREERMFFLQEINMNKDFLVQIISDLLDYSKIESGTLEYHNEEMDVNTAVMELVDAANIRPRDSGIKVEFAEKLDKCRFFIDKSRFAQMLNNLMENALKFTDHGSVKVGYRRLSNNSFYFYVADTGCGIDEEARRAIFDRFVKMNYNIRGTGLGLSITKSIVEHYGGGIGVESKKGEGSTFYFTLPAEVEFHKYGTF